MKLRDLIQGLLRVLSGGRATRYRPCFAPEEPDRIEPGVVYVIGEDPFQWAAVLKCPCGCGDDIWLNLLEGHSQCWKVTTDRRQRLSLIPSVNRIVGCRSHFFLRHNQIKWCGSPG